MTMSSFSVLPPEILEHVVQHLPTAKDLSHFSQISKSTHRTIEKDGWRAFVTKRFPSISTPPIWKDGAHALTTLSRNIDRRAFIAREIEPAGNVFRLPEGEVQDGWQRPKGQTMGYQAVLDSHEEFLGGDWASRRAVVACGTGAELVICTTGNKSSGTTQEDGFNGTQSARRQSDSSPSHEEQRWTSFREKHHVEGRDDVTSVNIVRPRHRSNEGRNADSTEIVVGRANGELTLLQTTPYAEQKCTTKHYNTSKTPVRSADVSHSQKPILAACLNDDRLAVYLVHSEQKVVQALGHANCADPAKPSCRTWSTRFLSEDKIAVGLGPSHDVVKIFNISRDGLTPDPIRYFRTGRDTPTSVYPIRPLPATNVGSSSGDGHLFISGGYDGAIRLHDLRSPADFVNIICDPVDNSAIFSLEHIGRERIIAGSSSHSLLKVFDLRMQGGRAYDYLSIDSQQSVRGNKSSFTNRDIHESGFNVFVGQNRQIASSRRRQARESPIYSLSRPSEASPMLYAGLENSVVEINFTSVADPYPEPVFKDRIQQERGTFSPHMTWFSPPPYALTLYEHLGSRNMQMLYQRNLGRHQRGLSVRSFEECEPGYDERLSRISTSTRLSAARSNFSR